MSAQIMLAGQLHKIFDLGIVVAEEMLEDGPHGLIIVAFKIFKIYFQDV